MNKYMLLAKNYEGKLVLSDGVKFYFPDRKWEKPVEGVITDIEITRDKETYGFIKARNITTPKIEPKELLGVIGKPSGYQIHTLEVGDSFLTVIRKDQYVALLIKVENEIIKVYESDSYGCRWVSAEEASANRMHKWITEFAKYS